MLIRNRKATSKKANPHGTRLAQRSALRKAVPLVGGALMVALQLLGVQWILFQVLHVPDTKIPLMQWLYPALTRPGHVTEPLRCAVVELQFPPTPFRPNACQIRQRLTEVLEALSWYGPSGIVVDFTLDPRSECSSTESLLRTARSLCETQSKRAPIPVIFGCDVGPDHQLQPCVLVPRSGVSRCAMGITSLRTDLRIIPLQYSFRDDWLNSLTWASVRQIRPELEMRLTQHLRGGSPLFSRLLTNLDFGGFIVTDDSVVRHQASTHVLAGRFVTVGSTLDDSFMAPSGSRVRGHVLHAGYVEAMLTDQYMRSVPLWVAVLLSIGFWLALESRSPKGALWVLLVGTVALFLLNLSLISWWQCYCDFPAIGVAAVLTRLLTYLVKCPYLRFLRSASEGW